MNTGWMAGRVGLCMGALVYGGCTSTVTLPAAELPALSTQNVQGSSEWPSVWTVEGETVKIIGPIQTIQVQGARGVEPVYQPFAARINGPYLEVFGPMGPRGFPLAEKPTILIEYDDLKKRRNAIGGTLIGVGAPVFATGVMSMAVGIDLLNSGSWAGVLGIFPIMYGVVGIGGGLGMVIPGIVMVASDPKKPETGTAFLQPKVHVRPGGIDLTMQF